MSVPSSKVGGDVALRVDISLTYSVNPDEYDADKAPGLALEVQELVDEGAVLLDDLIAEAKEILRVEVRPE